jgi:putative ABC transport system ATP-binding protein
MKIKKNQLIQLKNISKHYKMGETIVKAVDGISIEINEGDFVAIMGPSGSGKSTTMNLVGSLDTPTKGHIFLDGK